MYCVYRGFLSHGTPKSPIFLGGFSILNLPAIGYSPIYGNPESLLWNWFILGGSENGGSRSHDRSYRFNY